MNMEELLLMAKELNANIPEGALKRNSIYYELITYINHVISFLVCERYDDAALFIMRAWRLMETKYGDKEDMYIEQSQIFLEKVSEYLISGGFVTERGIQLLVM